MADVTLNSSAQVLAGQGGPAVMVPLDALARAFNLAGLPYADFLKVRAYLPLFAPAAAVPGLDTMDYDQLDKLGRQQRDGAQ